MGENEAFEQEKKKKIEEQMMSIYEKYEQPNGNPVTFISYYNQLIFQNEQGMAMYGLQDVYPVGVDGSKKLEKNRIVLYQEGIEIATIDENSNITFSQDYLMKMKEISPEIYLVLQQINGKHFELPEIQTKDENLPDISGKEKVEDFTLEKEDIESEIKQRAQDDQNQETEGQKLENEEPKIEKASEEDNIEKIAQEAGITKDDISSCSTINPQEKITDSKSFEDIANVTGKYTKIFVVASNSYSKDNSRFAFWGLTPDGQVEQIPGLEERQGVNTGKSIYAINRDGTEVKEQQTSALFTMPNEREGFSVTIGQYGIVETTYIRRSPEENKFIGSAINSTTQKPTTREVQEFMNDSRTTDRELQKTIDKTEHQLSETEKTNIKNIDNNPNNDVAIDMDAKIEMHDGTATTLREEAEKLDIPPEEYAKIFGETVGDCPSDKIETIRIEHAPQDADTDDSRNSREDRGERLTPEEMALRRMGMM